MAISAVLKASLVGFPTGLVFGFLLEKSKIYVPLLIRSQMRFQSFTMLKVFLTAMATSTLIVATLTQLGMITRKPRHAVTIGAPPSSNSNPVLQFVKRYNGNIIGGSLLGLGMTLTGSCPGTIYAQLGAGISSSLYVLSGALTGAFLYSVYDHYNSANQHTHESHERTPATIDGALKLNQLSTSLLVAVGVAAALYSVESYLPWRADLLRHLAWLDLTPSSKGLLADAAWAPVWAGLAIGLLQVPSLLLVNTQLGTSGSFVCIISHAATAVDGKAFYKLPYLSRFRSALDYWQLALVIGMVLGSFVSVHSNPSALAAVPVIDSLASGHVPRPLLALGGALLIFGARMAGGCTSGHGLSGFSQLSVASLVSVASMFGGGMTAAWLLPQL